MQVCKVIKGSSKQYYKIETQINELIDKGYIIDQMNTTIIGEYKTGLTSSTVESEILVILILREVEGNE